MRKLWDLLRNKIGTKNLICGILGICIAVGWMWSFTAWRVALVDKKICETQRGIADEVFRFHVLANSDSEKDQRVKLKVRDAVIAYMTSEMPGTTNQMDHAVTMDQAEQMNPGIHKNSAQATKKWAESHLNDLILVADEVKQRNRVHGILCAGTVFFLLLLVLFPALLYGSAFTHCGFTPLVFFYFNIS